MNKNESKSWMTKKDYDELNVDIAEWCHFIFLKRINLYYRDGLIDTELKDALLNYEGTFYSRSLSKIDDSSLGGV